MRLTHQTFSNQIPEFIREGYPLFLEFVKQYYRFLDQGAEFDVGDAMDIDDAPNAMIDQFYNTYARGLPTPVAFSKREFLRYCKEFYSSKGTPDSFNFLFKAFFNQEARISLPGDQMLRLSDGHWQQYCSVDIQVLFGNASDFIFEGAILDWSNANGHYNPTVKSVSMLTGPAKYRIVYPKGQTFNLITDQIINVYSGNAIVFRYKLVKSPSYIEIMLPGTGFQVGSVVIFKGTQKDTIARVKSLTSAAGIGSLEILEYGFDHTDGDVSLNSPYANVPSPGSYTLTSVNVGGSIQYSLSIVDYLQTTENITATYTVSSGNPYVANGYVNAFYTAETQAFSQITTVAIPTNGITDGSLTYAQWLASRAMLRIHNEIISVRPGKYITNQSLISDNFSRIQDSKFYQIYSYLISSNVDESQYKQVLGLVHPAGLARFGEITKVSNFDIGSEIIAMHLRELLESYNDNLFPTDAVSFTVAPVYSDSTTATTDSTSFTVAPVYSDSTTTSDTKSFVVAPVYSDSTPATDSTAFIVATVYSDTTTTSDSAKFTVAPVYSDSISMIVEGYAYTPPNSYFSGDYQLQDYNAVLHQVTIS